MTMISHEIRLDCERVVVEFNKHFDDGDFGAMAALFAPDGIWERAGGVLRGRDRLGQLQGSRPAGVCLRHVLSNFTYSPLPQGEVQVDSYVTVFKGSAKDDALPIPLTTPFIVGRYRDVLRQEDGGWVLAARKVFIEFQASA